ncbi:MAG: M1 family aminopeptidase, partial [Candidatus Korobacteraceae bacterium]
VGARGFWYPNRGLAMANFDMEFQSPKEWTLVATGKRVSQHTEGTEQISRWVSERPIPMAGFNLGEYERATAKAGDVSIEVYATRGMEKTFPRLPLPGADVALLPPPPAMRYPSRSTQGRMVTDLMTQSQISPFPPEPNRNAVQVAKEAEEMIDFMVRLVGPFPYSSLALSQKPGAVSQGWPGLVFLSSYAFLSQEERQALKMPAFESMMFGGLMTRHEVAHQWWGDLIGWKTYRDQWLVEALSTYCALLSIEKDDPRQFQAMLDIYRNALDAENSDQQKTASAGPVTLGVRLNSSLFPKGFETISYGRGTWLLHMLRHLLRDAEAVTAEVVPASRARRKQAPIAQNSEEPFFRVLRKLREQFEGKEISTADLQRLAEAELPESFRFERRKSLDWFFDSWVNGMAAPQIELKNVKFTRKGTANVITGVVVQRDAPDDLVTSVPIYSNDGGKLALLGRVFADGAETTFEFQAPLAARRIVVDPYDTVLSRK